MRLDEEKLEALRSWGERLRQGGGEESAAVGRAILMLIEEIDRLHIDLWHARLEGEGPQHAPPEPSGAGEEAPVSSSLHARLQRALRRGPDPARGRPGEPGSADAETDDTPSAQAWIDALRGQK